MNQFPMNSNKILEEEKFLSPNYLPNIYDYYSIYLLQKTGFSENFIWTMLKINQVKEVGFVSYQEDYLPGYNFYLTTESSLIIMSNFKATQALKLAQGIRSAQKQVELLDQNYLPLGIRESGQLLSVGQ